MIFLIPLWWASFHYGCLRWQVFQIGKEVIGCPDCKNGQEVLWLFVSNYACDSISDVHFLCVSLRCWCCQCCAVAECPGTVWQPDPGGTVDQHLLSWGGSACPWRRHTRCSGCLHKTVSGDLVRWKTGQWRFHTGHPGCLLSGEWWLVEVKDRQLSKSC